jgi:SAM-dependent methyltransferase
VNVRDSYDSVARAYADRLASELAGKPLDRHLLNRFAEEVRGRGLVADLGCGPGHVARYLHDQGVTVVGIDLSPAMIAQAQRLNPGLDFKVGDMRKLSLPDASLGGVIAFYSIVHFEPGELAAVMAELRRALAPGGLVLVVFHVGQDVVHVDELFGAPVNLDFRLHAPADVIDALRAARLDVIEQVERQPYPGAEHPSRRCYLLARAV